MTEKNEHLRDMIAGQAAAFYIAHREGNLSDEEEQEFLAWLRTSPMHVAEYLSLSGIAKDVERSAKRMDIPLAALIAQAKNGGEVHAIDPANLSFENFSARRRARDTAIHPALRWAMLAAACVAVAGITVFAVTRPQPKPRTLEFAAGHGEQRTLQLSDRTIAHLNSDSAITIHFDEHKRLVNVARGEVYFEVGKDAKRPFLVTAGALLLEDVGTAFDVFRKSDGTLVSVSEGKVSIQEKGRKGHVVNLHAGEQAKVSDTQIVKSADAATVRKTTAWLKQEIVFDRDTIAKAVIEFNRYNRTQIVIDDAQIAQLPISGRFHLYDLQSFAALLDATPGVRAITEGDTFHITRAPKAPHE